MKASTPIYRRKEVEFFDTCLPILFSATLYLSAQVISTFAFPNYVHAAEIIRCEGLFPRGYEIKTFRWGDHKEHIEAMQTKESMGLVQTFFSKKWDTQVYFTGTGLITKDGTAPLVDPQAKAVFLFFHGSGTMKSSGKNFVGNMNALAKLGFAALSFDMPFHAHGPRDSKMNDANVFMEWIKNIVIEAKKSGRPVILAGHSFGPDVIFEFVTRYPKLADGVVGLSPAAFNKVLSKWYDNETSKMDFGGATGANDAGGEWAFKVSKQFHWAKGKLKDPTLINPNLVVRILSGNREEYVPAQLGPNRKIISENTYDISVPLREAFRDAVITIESGIGHYLFDHADKNGFNVVQRELLLAAGETPTQIKKLEDNVREENARYAPSEQMGLKYSQDIVFRSWADQVYGIGKVATLSRQQNDTLADKILSEYSIAIKNVESEIYAAILNTKNTHPQFYEKYKKIIDTLNPKKTENSLFVPYFKEVLSVSATDKAE